MSGWSAKVTPYSFVDLALGPLAAARRRTLWAPESPRRSPPSNGFAGWRRSCAGGRRHRKRGVSLRVVGAADVDQIV